MQIFSMIMNSMRAPESIEAELLASNFQLYVNFYDRISDSINYTSGSTTLVEEVVNGYDFSAVGQLPYLPWANIIYNGYSWDSSGTDLEGNRISLEANLIRGILFEYGKNDIDNNSDDEDFYNITFKWPQNHLTPTLATHGITSYAFPVVNLKDKMLNKVRRTNNIITQRSGGGAVVTRRLMYKPSILTSILIIFALLITNAYAGERLMQFLAHQQYIQSIRKLCNYAILIVQPLENVLAICSPLQKLILPMMVSATLPPLNQVKRHAILVQQVE